MIKLLYAFSLLFIASITTVHAQRTADVALQLRQVSAPNNKNSLDTMTPYQTLIHDGKTVYYMYWSVVNLGPDTIYTADSIYVKLGWRASKSDVLLVPNIAPGEAFGIIPASIVAPSTLVGAVVLQPPHNMPIPSTDTLNWCDSLVIIAGASHSALIDPNMANNRSCTPIIVKTEWPVSVNDVSLQEHGFTIYPNPATGYVTIKLNERLTADATITLRDIVGKPVYSHLLKGTSGTVTHSFNVAHLPPGLYTAELHYNDRTIIQKFSIQ
ncbi:T9SS type A sorting domain-containing protein [Polluticoccus soli]|uniref:T9SS type A sorting domain-containing protein n=1 Tax=Polluticoccus soli TaxID=3034150 RepID=UPI0023E288FF|nr:T9SS type A sorting domain-containing protein [Flavipsychrobacter sp. JY13-12]